MGRGLAAPDKNPTPTLGPLGLVSTGLRITDYIVEISNVYEVRIFPVSENGENGISDERADGAMPPEFLG